MRYREPFTVFPRIMKSGKTVWYYQTYTDEGKRTTARSTGQKSKTAAKAFCQKLLAENNLIAVKIPTFNEYCDEWFIYDKCPYIRSCLARGKSYSHSFAKLQRGNLKKYILPVFGKAKLNDITPGQIESWLFSLLDKGLTSRTVNNNLSTLRIILNESERLGHLKKNPVSRVKPLTKDTKPKGVLSLSEIKEIFSDISYWNHDGNIIPYTANLLAASTGMRLGEIQGLQAQDLFEDYIHVCHSLERGGFGLKGTKTGKTRDIPIPSRVYKLLQQLKQINPTGFLFSYTGGSTAVNNRAITDALYRALECIGVNDIQRKERNLTFHSWRHFFNTTLRSNGIVDSKVQSITGHSTQAMTEHYTHFKLEDFQDIKKIQDSIIKIKDKK